MVVIDDADGPTSIAGLMGGARSEVQPDTTRVLLEVATWNGPNIHRTSWALGLRSEASWRFEKGLAPEQCMQAQAVAMPADGRAVRRAASRPARSTSAACPQAGEAIRLRESRVDAILGVPVSLARQREILQALDFEVTDAAGGLERDRPAGAPRRTSRARWT